MDGLWEPIQVWIQSDQAAALVRAVIKLIVGLVAARLVSGGLERALGGRLEAHQQILLRRVSFYTVAGLFLASALVELGFDLDVLLGAAGILTVALGFASQTSASNVISGLFLLGEKAFAVGEIIRMADITGEVVSIDLLSIKLRTFDNLYVRVPNENVIKAQITNLSRFPIRRLDLILGVAYHEDLDRVRTVLMDVADRNPLCLEEPAPRFIFQSFADSALTFQFSTWATRENYLDLKTGLQLEIKAAFDEHGIEIPFPHRTLYTGSQTEPFPVRVVEGAA
ncbi:MAG: mechanosensitive ion channel family protein [Rhodothermales bacterium]|nr:mechanosensitive ion channel family protein [Rhodothermales bacterium]